MFLDIGLSGTSLYDHLLQREEDDATKLAAFPTRSWDRNA